jgi:hypothetical protein
MPWCPFPEASCLTYRCRQTLDRGRTSRCGQQVRPADQLKAIEILLDRGFGRSPQQLDVAHNVSSRPLEHLSDETLRLLVEYGQQLRDGSGVVIDGEGQVVTEERE